MKFQEDALKSEVLDREKILNDDVYRSKQEKKMISRLSPFDKSILDKPVRFLNPPCNHPDLHIKIFDWYFTFEKQYNYFY
jgi:hypothetical protein